MNFVIFFYHSVEEVPFPFSNTDELIRMASAYDMKISEIVWENERTWYSDDEIRTNLREVKIHY